MKLYSIVDSIKGSAIAVFMAENDGIAVRENAPTFSRVLPLGDLVLKCLGEIDVDDLKVDLFPAPVTVKWDSYKFPESPLPIIANATVKGKEKTK